MKFLFFTYLVILLAEPNSAFIRISDVHHAIKRHVPWILSDESTAAATHPLLKKTTLPLVMTTWPFGENATRHTYQLVTDDNYELLDAVEKSLSEACELEYCANGVGPYYKTDEHGDLTLDAMMMDGSTYEIGAVGNLRHVRRAISVARAVMKYTKSTLITGDQATEFAEMMGFTREELRTNDTEQRWQEWKDADCQPNFRKNVIPDPESNCGPYAPQDSGRRKRSSGSAGKPDAIWEEPDHDTICQIAIDDGNTPRVVIGTTTNGLDRKIPGRVGDTPIPGAGGFADSTVGAAVATGNGDLMMRSLPSYQAVEEMRGGKDPQLASQAAMARVRQYFPTFEGALMAADIEGYYGAACVGYDTWTFAIQGSDMDDVTMVTIDCEESMAPVQSGAGQPQSLAWCVMLWLVVAILLK